MTGLISDLKTRRSIRSFQQKTLTTDDLDTLQEALVRSPTSRGRNPWHFIQVTDRDILEKISRAKQHGSTFLAGAAAAFVICGDENVSDVWVEDCAIAAITLQYTAHSIGLGSCWAQIRLREHDAQGSAEAYLQELLGIPEHIRVASIVGIGYPAEEKEGHPEKDLPRQKIHFEHF